MSKENPYRDQAEKLRQKIERTDFEEGQVIEKEELPPRSRVHEQKRKKNKWKLKYPVIRLLALFFILLPITILSIYSILAKDGVSDVKKTVGEPSEGFEIINIEKSDQLDPPIDKENETQEEDDDQSVESSINEIEHKDEALEETTQQQNLNQSSQDIVDSLGEISGPKDIIYHTVQPDDTLYSISMKYYKSKAGIDTIKSTNGLTSNEIRIGQVLTISLNK
ncbi:LysM peptidoglycan-binding domain-containing protein [Bacillus sp. V3B]|uniref:LysM peptidoglycan-binding domain-containing protein n=1 Tax=Bacillus sp. V3B TaxID=2804915 RepID=UPI002108DD1F|nr:LysM peptidoglycan-binding domain-containing protein [Bacillus sp. V3B]MCQ6273845.1 LysM peptidoglycan-binding domain-containing protein [Bacillus sp. V3B]